MHAHRRFCLSEGLTLESAMADDQGKLRCVLTTVNAFKGKLAQLAALLGSIGSIVPQLLQVQGQHVQAAAPASPGPGAPVHALLPGSPPVARLPTSPVAIARRAEDLAMPADFDPWGFDATLRRKVVRSVCEGLKT